MLHADMVRIWVLLIMVSTLAVTQLVKASTSPICMFVKLVSNVLHIFYSQTKRFEYVCIFYFFLVVGCAFAFVLSDTVSTFVTLSTPLIARGVAFDPTASIVYLATQYQIMSMAFLTGGVKPSPTVLAGGISAGFADGQGTAALFNWPTGMAIHMSGDI